jgi:Putative Ig domain
MEEPNASLIPASVLTVTAVNDAPTVAAPIPDATAREGQAFSYAVPAETFSDVDAGDTLAYSATLENGSALPSWLSFDAGTLTFSGTPDFNAQGALAVEVTATDGAGAEASDTFDIEVANVPTLHSYTTDILGSVQDWVDEGRPDSVVRYDAAIAREDANGVNPDFDQYGIYEFDVGNARNATAATLRVDPESGANLPNQLNVYAYIGDGVVTVPDEDRGVLVGSVNITADMTSGKQYVPVSLDTGIINDLLAQSGEWLGFRLEVPDEPGGPVVNTLFFENAAGLQSQLDLIW